LKGSPQLQVRKKRWCVAVIVVLSILFIKPTNQTYGFRPETQSLEAVGTVIAYDQLVPLTNITWVLQSQVLLIRISKSVKGQAAGPYIKVVYKYAANDSPLPQRIFDGNTSWRFIVKRDISCDSSLQEMKATKAQTKEGTITVPRLKFKGETALAEQEVALPCYVLKPGKYRMEK
jgi:hypothetical protein